jgi:TBC1 domain family protein 5
MTASSGLQKSTLRSLVWLKLLGHFPQTTRVNAKQWVTIMTDAREEYEAVASSVLVSSKSVTGLVSQEVKRENDFKGKPLSSETAGAVFQMLKRQDFQRLIWKDVIRTQQRIAWFSEKETQNLCARILLVWSLAHPKVGYKQGMNELLAVIMYLVCTERGGLGGEGHMHLLESVSSSNNNSSSSSSSSFNEFNSDQMKIHHLMNVLLDPKYCEADAYLIFSLVMVRMEPVFCPTDDHHDTIHTTKRDTMSLLQRFSRVQAEIVHLENPALAEHMIMCGVEAHMYLLRWMRLLCSRKC